MYEITSRLYEETAERLCDAIGSGNAKQAGKAVGNAIAFFAIAGIVLTVILVGLARPIARLMQAPEEALQNTVNYIRICGMGIIFIIAYNIISCIMRGLGNSRLPLIFVAIACVANIIGDYVLIAIFHMDESGAAIATVAAQAISVVLSLAILRRQKLPFTLTKDDFIFSGELRRFLRIGFPMAAQELMTQISFLALIAFINNLGLEASGGYGVANKIVSFVMLVPSSLVQSMSSFVAQNIGAGRRDRARKTLYTGMGIGIVMGIITFSLSFFFGREISGIFSSDPRVIARSAEYLRGFAPEAVVTSILFSFSGYFSGQGKTLFVMVQSLAQTLLVRLPVAYAMSIQPDASLAMIGLAAPLATCFGIAINGAGMDFLLGLGRTRITLVLNFTKIFILRIPVLLLLQRFISDGATALGIMMMISNCGIAIPTTIICVIIARGLLLKEKEGAAADDDGEDGAHHL